MSFSSIYSVIKYIHCIFEGSTYKVSQTW